MARRLALPVVVALVVGSGAAAQTGTEDGQWGVYGGDALHRR
jgi:hypothetical protein